MACLSHPPFYHYPLIKFQRPRSLPLQNKSPTHFLSTVLDNTLVFSIMDAMRYNEQQEIKRQGSAIDGREYCSARYREY
jgi:hypothetical protein